MATKAKKIVKTVRTGKKQKPDRYPVPSSSSHIKKAITIITKIGKKTNPLPASVE